MDRRMLIKTIPVAFAGGMVANYRGPKFIETADGKEMRLPNLKRDGEPIQLQDIDQLPDVMTDFRFEAYFVGYEKLGLRCNAIHEDMARATLTLQLVEFTDMRTDRMLREIRIGLPDLHIKKYSDDGNLPVSYRIYDIAQISSCEYSMSGESTGYLYHVVTLKYYQDTEVTV